jgi:heat shock protein HslJ
MTRHWIAVPAVAVLLASCANQANKEPPPKPFVGTRWEVILELPLSGEQPTLRFGDGRVEGFGGCNQFLARYVQDTVGSRFLAIGRMETTHHGCDPGPQASEDRLLAVLQAVSSYMITGDSMVMSGSGGSLKLRAVP